MVNSARRQQSSLEAQVGSSRHFHFASKTTVPGRLWTLRYPPLIRPLLLFQLKGPERDYKDKRRYLVTMLILSPWSTWESSCLPQVCENHAAAGRDAAWVHTVQDDAAVRGLRLHQRSALLASPRLWPTWPGFWVRLHHEWLQALLSLLLLQQRSLGKIVIVQPGEWWWDLATSTYTVLHGSLQNLL